MPSPVLAVAATAALVLAAVAAPVEMSDAPVEAPAEKPPAPTVRYADPAPPRPARVTAAAEPVAPLDETFALHSNAGAARTIFIDVDGGRVAGSAWNVVLDLLAGTHPAWDPADDGPSFSAGERELVQDVWRRVAEDFAPYDVDVTTEDPGDLSNGVRALVTPSQGAMSLLCGTCSGIAYLDVFGDGYYDPAWVFAQRLWGDPSYVAEAVSHEVGHNLGLHHDGTSTREYHNGSGEWAPIMGAGFGKDVTQWSRGSYPDADNAEQDVSIIGAVLGFREDEAGPDAATAVPLGGGGGFISRALDTDTYRLPACIGPTTIIADPAETGPDLDIRLDLLGADDVVVATSEPSGMAASLTVDLPASEWFVRVDGAGEGTWETGGYDDYSSLGAYRVTVEDCGGEEPPVDGPPTDVPGDQPFATRTRLSLPARAVRGSRPWAYVRVAEAGSGEDARGSVRLTVDGRTVGTASLRLGVVRHRLPRLTHVGRVTVRATYVGTGELAGSKAVRSLLVVRRAAG